MHARYPVLAFALSLAGGLLYVRFGGGTGALQPSVQPVDFSHAAHAHHPKKPLPCKSCHRGVENDVRATLPTVEMCTACHLKPKGETVAERLLIDEFVEPEREIPWRRLFTLPDHVFFSHRQHVVRAEIECQACHGAMDERQTPPPRALHILTMSDCMDCHAERRVEQDCNRCHR